MPAANDVPDAGENVDTRRHATGVNVRMNVIHGHKRNVESHAERLSRGNAHKQRTGEARRIGDSDRRDVGERRAGAFQALINHRQDSFNVRSRSDLRYDAAEHLVEFVLRGDARTAQRRG